MHDSQRLKLQYSPVIKISMIAVGIISIIYGILLAYINNGYYPGCILFHTLGVYLFICACRFIEVKTDRIVYRNYFKKNIIYFKDIKVIEEIYTTTRDIDFGYELHISSYVVRDLNNKKLFTLGFGDVEQFIKIAKKYNVRIRRVQ